MMTNDGKALLTQPKKEDWRPKVIAIGGAIGAAVGIFSALLYIRSAEETGFAEQPTPPDASDAVRMGITLMGIVRTITEWAKK